MSAPSGECILVVQTGFLGDVVLTTPLLQVLRQRFPEAEVTLLVTPAAAPLMAHHPAVDRVEIDDKRGADRGLRGMLALGRRLRRRRYALALAAHKSWRTGALLLLAGIPRRVGFAGAPAASLYTERVPRPLALHDCERLLQLMRPFGALGTTPQPSLALDQEACRQAHALLAPARATGRPLAGICPGSVWRTKRWPASAYAELVRRLEAAGYACVLLGSPDERELTRLVHERADGRGLDLGGATDLTVLAAVLAEMSVVVSNDSAPMHLATAVGVPQVAIFCATVPEQGYGPRSEHAQIAQTDLECRPCGRHGAERCPRGTDDCMELIRVEDVAVAVERARALAA